MAREIPLVASYWTLASGAVPHTDHEYSTWTPARLADRAAATTRAQFPH